MQTPARLVVLLSGSGTTLQNLLDQQQDPAWPAQIVGVISSKKNAYGVVRASKASVPVQVLSPKPEVDFSDRVFSQIRQWQPDLVILAGWIHLLHIPADFEQKILNVHPSLLPAFGGPGMYGHHVHAAVLNSGARYSGCTVHFADETYDTGPIVHQAVVPVHDNDNPTTLAERVQAAEREAYPEAIRRLILHPWRIVGKRVRTAS